MRILLVGNPNCGKTTLFNRLTGARQKVGNWAGVTVEKKSGLIRKGRKGTSSIEVIDLPGLYGLNSASPTADERVAEEVFNQGDFDLILNVVDAANLQRHLILTSQLKALGKPVWLALTMTDVAQQGGLLIDAEILARQLELPVYPVVGSSGEGMNVLVGDLVHHAQAHSEQATATTTDFGNATTSRHSTESMLAQISHHQLQVALALQGVVQRTESQRNFTDIMDRIVLHRWLGIPIFLAVMYLMFTMAVNLGAVFIDFFDILGGALFVDGFHHLLSLVNAPEFIHVILADGMGGAMQIVGTFVPVIAGLYLCLSFLEDSGYLSRAAFVVDKLMSRIGLPGQAFVPLIVGFGCNVPAVMSARTLSRQADRLLTMLMAPFMSCSARLTVYVLFAATFFPEQGQNVIFLLYLFGIMVAVFSGWLFRKHIFALVAEPSLMEMPAYHLPVWRNIFITTWHRLQAFVLRAGKTIVLVVTFMTVLSSVTVQGTFDTQAREQSLMAYLGQSATPLLKPLGVKEENWPATVGLITGIFAKEAVVGTMVSLYSPEASSLSKNDNVLNNEPAPETWQLAQPLGEAVASIGENLRGFSNAILDPLGLGEVDDQMQGLSGDASSTATMSRMQNGFDGALGAFCFLLLVLLYSPCVAVMAAIRREAGLMWMLTVVSWTTSIGYIISSLVYQFATLSQHPLGTLYWTGGVIVSFGVFVWGLKWSCRPVFRGDIPVVNC